MAKNNTLQEKLNESINASELRDKLAIECGNKILTYSDLDERSSQVAKWILGRGIPGETFIGILVVDRIEFIIITIGILKARCVFIPLEPSLPLERLKLMIHSTDTKFVIGDKVKFDLLFSDNLNDKLSSEVEFISVDTCLTNINSSRPIGNIDIHYSTEDKIYVYFTSGTTGDPRAFVGKNKSLLHFINWEINTLGINGYYRISQLINPGFDAFLRDVFVPLCSGGVICIPEYNEILLNPLEMVKWLERSRINLIHCVPSLFRTFNSIELTKNHFKELKYILLSGEKIEPLNLVNWYKIFNDRIQLVNLWGTSETTLAKTYYFINKSDIKKERMPVGKPIKGSMVLVLNENMDICEDMAVGEVYIRTPYRTFGYYNQSGLNKQRFIKNPFNDDTDDLLHKTGDLGRLLPDGNLEILGRVDRQVKIRGIRIELEEIESILILHPAVKEAVVIKKDLSNQNELLYAYITENTEDNSGEESLESILKDYLSKRLPDYMVPSQIFGLKEIPRTSNRKIDYKRLSEGINNVNPYIPPRNELEKRILALWANILGIEKTKISVTKPFFELGGNSLNIMTLIAKIHREFDIRISLGEIFKNPTIRKQAIVISKAEKDKDNNSRLIVMTEKKEYYSLSYSQKRIYTALQLELDSTSYNMPVILRLIGELDRERLQETFLKLIERHESLRTSFEIIENEPVQRVWDKIEFAVEYLGQGKEILELRKYIRAFDLTMAPLLRIYLLQIEDREYGMMIDISHLISDGVSSMLMARDLMTLYNKQELPPLNIQYKDFAEWENRLFQTGNVKKQEDFWVDTFSGELPVLELPTDFSRPHVRNVDAGDTISSILKESPKQKLDEIIRKTDSTLFIFLLAIYNVLLNKYSGQEDIVVGSVVTGRIHEDLENVMGVFINMLPFRNRPQPGKRFRDFLEEVKVNALQAFDNQDYPMEELVKKLKIRNNPGRHPLFDTESAVNNIEFEEIDIPGLKMENYASGINFAKFDLHFLAIERNHTLNIILRYSTELFKKTTAQKIIRHFIEIIGQVIENPGIKLEDIELTVDLVPMKSNSPGKEQGYFNF
ncbi:MAG TPA: condensation domain-containing protein [Candidatus Kapabacteria bacterium]|nr:condensation domain-containing protein [Candidatus Kapabacteria bacterium]